MHNVLSSCFHLPSCDWHEKFFDNLQRNLPFTLHLPNVDDGGLRV